MEIYSNKNEDEMKVTIKVEQRDGTYTIEAIEVYVPAIDSWLPWSDILSSKIEDKAHKVVENYFMSRLGV